MRSTAEKIKSIQSLIFEQISQDSKGFTEILKFSSLEYNGTNKLLFKIQKIVQPHNSVQVLNIRLVSLEVFSSIPKFNFLSLAIAPDMSKVMVEIQNAFDQGIYPEINIGGTSESYLLKDCENFPIAIFKPSCSQWGSDSKKEIAAYRLDYDHFAKVPPTVMATFSHPFFKGAQKIRQGSCQWYVFDSTTAMHVEHKKILKLPAECVRRLAILDIRLINPDRHTSNLLYREFDNKIELIPIDHGAILPENLFGASYAWTNWEQAKTPFDQEELDYIFSLDPLKDAQILFDELQISRCCVENMIGATCLLKEAALRGWNCFQIGKAISREFTLLENGKREWKFSLLENVMKVIREKSIHNLNHFLVEMQIQINHFLEFQ